MKKFISLFLVFALLTVLCACGEQNAEPTDPQQEQTQLITDSDAVTTEKQEEASLTTEAASSEKNDENATTATAAELTADIPVLEDYTLVAEDTKTKNNFVFEGEKEQTQTCDKIVMVNKDGATEIAFSFAADGSALTAYTFQPDGSKYSSLIEFDKQGRLSGIFNGSGSYSIYTYADNTCVLEAYDADKTMIDKRVYYYNDKEQTERVERGDEESGTEIYMYTYNENDQLVSLRVENNTGYIVYDSSYTEDKSLKTTRIEQNNEFYALQVYTYDENGRLATYTIRNDENAEHWADVTVNYHNVYAEDGTYLGTSEVDSQSQEVYITVAYDYVQTEYPHYADFIETHYMKY